MSFMSSKQIKIPTRMSWHVALTNSLNDGSVGVQQGKIALPLILFANIPQSDYAQT